MHTHPWVDCTYSFYWNTVLACFVGLFTAFKIQTYKEKTEAVILNLVNFYGILIHQFKSEKYIILIIIKCIN